MWTDSGYCCNSPFVISLLILRSFRLKGLQVLMIHVSFVYWVPRRRLMRWWGSSKAREELKVKKFLKGTATNLSAAMLAKSCGPFAMTLGLWKKNKPYREEERKSFFLQHSWKSHCSMEFTPPPPFMCSFGMDFAPLLASLRHFIVRCIYGLWNQIYKAEPCFEVLQF